MKNYLKITAIGLLSMGMLLGCSNEKEKVESQEHVKKIIVGTSADYEPFEFLNKNNEIVGFDIDIVKKVAKGMGAEVEIKNIPFDNLMKSLKEGKIDVLAASLSPTAERLKQADFSDVYYVSSSMVVSKLGSNILSIDDLEGKKVGVQGGTIQEDKAKDIQKDLPSIKVSTYKMATELFDKVKKGEVDAGIVEDSLFLNHLGKEIDGFVIEDENQEGSAFAFRKNSPLVEPFNNEIKKLKTNNELENLIQKWIAR